MDKKILDVTCGARSIWFDKHHPAAVYCDKRREQYHHLWKNAGNCTLDINPDVMCDFTELPFPDNSFPLADHCDRTNYGCHTRAFLLDAATALSALQIENQALRNAASGFKAENEKLREMYQKEKAVCHATQAELDQVNRENETLKHALQNWHEED